MAMGKAGLKGRSIRDNLHHQKEIVPALIVEEKLDRKDGEKKDDDAAKDKPKGGLAGGSVNTSMESQDTFGAGAWLAHPSTDDSDSDGWLSKIDKDLMMGIGAFSDMSDDDEVSSDMLTTILNLDPGVVKEEDLSDNDMPELESVSDSLEDEEELTDDEFDDLPDLEDVEDSHDDEDNLEPEVGTSTMIASTEDVNLEKKDKSVIELYDSGTSQHMSPHQQAFLDYHDIHPKSFDTANKNKFLATGQGDMIVSLLHGSESTKIQLTKVLYALDLAYTLILVSCLDDAGYSVTFGSGKGVIRDKEDTMVDILPNTKGLYCYIHKTSGEAHTVKEKLTFMDLHH
ncbi:hypothetical protein EDD18DRAFT_1356200 [Armillaria luteobubalina]|uniref:Retrovirus-related Pol polyprotein from transposon TNT 1-94-like beta-barrel domain-containing protein n=1 Tax=Armillaria luteobubalina TaxID=153913 RepID=A0AA39Q0A7_9AGAR|nr:hypothetical protein EDD18DRAFT_1356200 [Armillaria luteobubalina]